MFVGLGGLAAAGAIHCGGTDQSMVRPAARNGGPRVQLQPAVCRGRSCGANRQRRARDARLRRGRFEPALDLGRAPSRLGLRRNGLESWKRAVSELQLAAAIEIVAMTATRYHGASEAARRRNA